MKVHYDADVDILYIVVKDGPALDSRELNEGIILELGENDGIVGIQIMNARRSVLAQVSEEIAKEVKSKIAAI